MLGWMMNRGASVRVKSVAIAGAEWARIEVLLPVFVLFGFFQDTSRSLKLAFTALYAICIEVLILDCITRDLPGVLVESSKLMGECSLYLVLPLDLRTIW